MSKRGLLFTAVGGRDWIGGLYYIKNIIYVLLQNERTESNYNLYIYVSKENRSLFEVFLQHDNVSILEFTDSFSENELIKICEKYNISSIYPVLGNPYFGLEELCVYWIPDFQHKHLQNLFSKEDIEVRDRLYEFIAKEHRRLILSSNDSYNDYKKLYPQYAQGTYVVPFVSFIENEIYSIDKEFYDITLIKYNLTERYVYLPNQFWQHKNHITVFKAFNQLIHSDKLDLQLVCTGYLEDNRNKEHFAELKKYIYENKLEENIKILGFIPRREQLVIMQEASLILQPSLFEGWGTVVEDAKVLDKKMILSDIEVHKEQKNEKCMIFERHNDKQLAKIIKEEFLKSTEDCIEKGISNSQKKAKEYSVTLYEVFNYESRLDYKNLFHKQKMVLNKIFSGSQGKKVGIYGTGEHTESLINMYKKFIGEIDFEIFFFDSSERKWGKEYFDTKIYNPKYIDEIGLDRIIISSFSFQDEIYESLKHLEDQGIRVITIYSKNNYNLFRFMQGK